MFEYLLNIIGSEWMIIIFVALILLLGTNRFPEAVKKIGKIVGEYKKAKDTVEKQMKDVYGIKIQVATKDDSQLVSNDISLTASGKI